MFSVCLSGTGGKMRCGTPVSGAMSLLGVEYNFFFHAVFAENFAKIMKEKEF